MCTMSMVIAPFWLSADDIYILIPQPTESRRLMPLSTKFLPPLQALALFCFFKWKKKKKNHIYALFVRCIQFNNHFGQHRDRYVYYLLTVIKQHEISFGDISHSLAYNLLARRWFFLGARRKTTATTTSTTATAANFATNDFTGIRAVHHRTWSGGSCGRACSCCHSLVSCCFLGDGLSAMRTAGQVWCFSGGYLYNRFKGNWNICRMITGKNLYIYKAISVFACIMLLRTCMCSHTLTFDTHKNRPVSYKYMYTFLTKVVRNNLTFQFNSIQLEFISINKAMKSFYKYNSHTNLYYNLSEMIITQWFMGINEVNNQCILCRVNKRKYNWWKSSDPLKSRACKTRIM